MSDPKLKVVEMGQEYNDEHLDEAPRTITNFERIRIQAIEYVKEKRRELLESPIDEELILVRFTNDEVITQCNLCEQLLVDIIAKQRLVKSAEARLKLEKQKLQYLIIDQEDINPNDNFEIDFSHRLAHKPEVDEEEISLAGKIVDASRIMANLNDETVATIQGGEVPEEWNQIVEEQSGLKDLFTDLAEFIQDTGEKGREFLNTVLSDRSIARKVKNDEDVPQPIRFLADQVLKAGSNKEE